MANIHISRKQRMTKMKNIGNVGITPNKLKCRVEHDTENKVSKVVIII